MWADIKGENNAEPKPKSEPASDQVEEPAPATDIFTKPDLNEYIQKVSNLGYTHPDIPQTNDFIHVIDENELDEDNYQIVKVMVYADGIVTDENDVAMRDADRVMGDFLTYINGKDQVFIRNEKLSIDYQLDRSEKTYGEMLDDHPEILQRFAYEEAREDYYEDLIEEEGDDGE